MKELPAVYAYTVVIPDPMGSREAVIAFSTDNGLRIPMMHANLETAREHRDVIQEICNKNGVTAKLVKFESRKEIEHFMPTEIPTIS